MECGNLQPHEAEPLSHVPRLPHKTAGDDGHKALFKTKLLAHKSSIYPSYN